MKTKILSLMVLFCVQFASLSHAEIVFRQASVDDLRAILEVYRSYTEEDRKTLVTFPENINPKSGIPFDEEKLRKDLGLDRLFISEDDESHKVLGLLKLFVIDEPDLNEILEDELHVLGKDRVQSFAETFDSRKIYSRHEFFKERAELSAECVEFKLKPTRQVFIYYGGAYTVPAERGNQIHSKLLSKAMSILEPELVERLKSFPIKKQIIFVYGQVQANTESKGMIHSFSEFVQNLALKNVKLSSPVYHIGYQASKPTFSFNSVEERLEVSFPEDGRGVGNLVIFRLRRR